MATVLDTIITEKMKKTGDWRVANAQLAAVDVRIKKLTALIGDDDNPLNPNRAELDRLVALRPSLLEAYEAFLVELDALDLDADKEIEVHNAEVEKSARVLAGEEPLTTKETIGYMLCGVALVSSGLTFAYFTHGYLAYVFGL